MGHILKPQRGLAAVEFVLISPLLILFMAMFIEIGSVFIDYQTLNKSVRNGARHAVNNIYGDANANLQRAPDDETKNIVVFGIRTGGETPLLPGLTVENVTIAPDLADVDSEITMVTVTAVYDYMPIFLKFPWVDIDTNFKLTASAVMETK